VATAAQAFDDTGALNQTYRQQVYSRGTHKTWGLGPKGQFDFEYLLLPNCWDHSLNVYFSGQGALLYGKTWAYGKYIGDAYIESVGTTPQSESVNNRWSSGPRNFLIPNLNLDFGLKCAYESLDSVILKFAVGYRMISYWNMSEAKSEKYFRGGFNTIAFDEHTVYTGPYARFSLAF